MMVAVVAHAHRKDAKALVGRRQLGLQQLTVGKLACWHMPLLQVYAGAALAHRTALILNVDLVVADIRALLFVIEFFHAQLEAALEVGGVGCGSR
jgi:hypothetical protein